MWFMGTNDQPGDYRQSGCAGCHVVYANDREPRHSLTYARYGRDGQTATVDPAIAGKRRLASEGHGALVDPAHVDEPARGESGHPITHAFTRAIPTAQRSEEHTSELQSLMRTSYAVFCWK